MKTVTLREIAEKLNISVTTVSKALKDYKDVNSQTRARVREMAEALNYKPNPFAVNLRTQESRTIGLIIPEVVHHFFSSVIKGIIAKAEKKGYMVIILQSNESYELEKKQVDLLLRKNVDGILISLSNETNNFDHLNQILSAETPLVMFDKIAKLVKCSKVVIDDRKAAYTATKHLIDIGCKKIAHFRGPLTPQNSIDRFLGYKKAIEDHGLPFDKSLVYLLEDMSFEEGKYFAKELLKDHTDVDGIFINTDLVALGALNHFKTVSIKVPEDISIVGFSNWFMSEVVTPSLTTIHQPGFKMGKKAFKLLLNQIQEKKELLPLSIQEAELSTKLIIRNSSLKSST